MKLQEFVLCQAEFVTTSKFVFYQAAEAARIRSTEALRQAADAARIVSAEPRCQTTDDTRIRSAEALCQAANAARIRSAEAICQFTTTAMFCALRFPVYLLLVQMIHLDELPPSEPPPPKLPP